MLLWGAAAVLAALALIRVLGAHDGAQVAPAPVSVSGGSDAAAGRDRGQGGPRLYVHVAGRVRRPGLYRLRTGDRVASALERAGGAARGADLAAINLAAKVEDGQQVLVPSRGGAAAAANAAGADAAPGEAGQAKLSLTTASAEQLDELDGIGPTLAKRIVEYREQHGGFRSVGDLNEVEGIGEKRMQALREAVGP